MSTERPPQPLPDYLGTSAVAAGVIEVLIALTVAALAASRATAHVLTPAGLAGVVAGAAAMGMFVSWPAALYGGAADLLRGRIRLPEGFDPPRDRDPFEARSLWRTTYGWALAVGIWAAAGAGLLAVALDGRRAGLLVVFVALAGIGGVATLALGTLGRRVGVEAAHRIQDRAVVPVPLRRRAWLHLALPIALGQVAVNAGFAWLLFHDYEVGDRFAPEALTEQVALADVGLIVGLVCVIFAYLARQWGEVDARLGRVGLDDAAVQSVPAKAPLGRQGVVYLALVAWLVVGPLLGLLLPPEPSLGAVIVLRALFAGLLAAGAVGIAYIRGAANALANQQVTV